mgnify:CR=1 FL=1
MSQQDHHSPNQGLFAGRRVTVVQPDTLSRDRLVGQLSVLRYQDAGVITSQQMALLQRLLPRTRLESLLGSIWFQRRLDAALAVAALFGAHVSSRLAPLFVIATLPHVGDTPRSKSKPLADAISAGALLTDTGPAASLVGVQCNR